MVRASHLLGPDGPIASKIASYEHREGQLAMADAVEDAIARRGISLIEAGTGTGKTWAYLLAAVLSGERVVISTASRALQDQIVLRDVPMLREVTGIPMHAVAMKGLQNYLCLRRLESLRALGVSGALSSSLARDLAVVEAWRANTPTGDQADLPLAEDSPIWPHVHSSTDTRIGSRCSFFDECFVTQMKSEAQHAQIIVVNHHLYFADLTLRRESRGMAVIPDHEVAIFDEAHSIADIATVFFGTTVATTHIEKLAREHERACQVAGELPSAAQALRSASETFYSELCRGRVFGQESRAPLSRSVFTDSLEERYFDLDSALDSVRAQAEERKREHENFAPIVRRAEMLRDGLARITDVASGTHAGWLSVQGNVRSVGISPIDVSLDLERELFLPTKAVILTSATLSTTDKDGTPNFQYIKRTLGLRHEVDELVVKSPFDFTRQAGLFIPEKIPDPRAPDFVQRAAEHILGLVSITEGGAFVLCTSYRNMEALAQACRPTLIEQGYTVSIQGEGSRTRLLEKFRAAGDGVLFATSSFWEGVDVPGRALRLVIVDKIPFEVPSDPVLSARCAALEKAGGNPFLDQLVPAAALGLKQGFGRLIRTREDRGIISILDVRLLKKGYGAHFLRALPNASRLYSLEEASAFWRSQW